MIHHDVTELRLIGAWLNEAHPIDRDSDGDRVLAAADTIERLAGALQKIIDRSNRSEYEPATYPTEYSKAWHDGHCTATSTHSLTAREALDPEGWAESETTWRLARHGTDREWLERTGCCGHCGMLARLCCCTADDPCRCGPHEIEPWPRDCWTCEGTGKREWKGTTPAPGGVRP